MVSDRVRMAAYEAALRATVRPGSVVLDIGTGTGIFACLACRLGARKVYAVDPSDVVRVAREVAAANGVADRIEFFQATSRAVELPEPADVIVSDLRGVLPPFGRHFADLADAGRRFLRADGALIPLCDRVHASVVEAPGLWAHFVAPSDEEAFGFDMAAARRSAADVWHKARLEPEMLLTEPAEWAAIDYRDPEAAPLDRALEWEAARAGTGHGIAAWFDAELAPGVGFSNAPGAPPALYGQAYFPWPEPVPLAPGDRVRVHLRAVPAADDHVWTWSTRVTAPGGAEKARFESSTLRSALPSLERLRRGMPDHVPRLGVDGEVEREALLRMDGTRTVAQVAAELAALFPGLFPTPHSAVERVAGLSRELAR
jgi:protein arginine N-methyltransferase 1